MKAEVSDEQEPKEVRCESAPSSSASEAEDDFPLFSDIPIMRIGTANNVSKADEKLKGIAPTIPDNCKPQGSAYISIQMSIGSSPEKADANLCVDTGADFTICDSAFLISHFGPNALQHLYYPERLPKLRSASGHELPMLGKLKTTLYMGSYEMKLNVLVHESS